MKKIVTYKIHSFLRKLLIPSIQKTLTDVSKLESEKKSKTNNYKVLGGIIKIFLMFRYLGFTMCHSLS